MFQAALAEVSGDALYAWKIAATSEAGQRRINVDGPLAGRLFSRPVTVSLGGRLSWHTCKCSPRNSAAAQG